MANVTATTVYVMCEAPVVKHLWKMSMSSVAIMVGSLSRLARMAASDCSKLSWDSTDAYRKLLRMGSCAASLAASFLQTRQSDRVVTTKDWVSNDLFLRQTGQSDHIVDSKSRENSHSCLPSHRQDRVPQLPFETGETII